jgi:AraC family transcriptional regulator
MHPIYTSMAPSTASRRRVRGHALTHSARNTVAVHRERAWRQPDLDLTQITHPVIASHWLDHDRAPRELTAQSPRGYYVASIFMCSTELVLEAGTRDVYRGELHAGSVHVSPPGQRLRARFEGPCEILHLHLSHDFVRRAATAHDSLHLLSETGLVPLKQDTVIEQLGRALLAADDRTCGWQFAERLATPIITRYFHLLAQAHLHSGRPLRIALPRWRLQRVHDYVHEHLNGRITLLDMARAAGLSPMHFAAQFRISTGLRPHEYLLQCRIERAKTLLTTTSRALIDLSLEVGFSTQAHFTTVFKRFTGTTPNQWRWQHSQPSAIGTPVAPASMAGEMVYSSSRF